MQRRDSSGLFTFVFLLFALSGEFAFASDALPQSKTEAPEFNVKEHYTKYEYRIPMRDGVHLFTAVYAPKDSSQAYPFLILRTPYSVAPYGVDQYRKGLGPSVEFDKTGYIFVFQDVRGRYMSEGTFVEMTPHIDHKQSKHDVDDASDLYDTIDWLLKNVPNNNGNAGIWGISYPGFYTSASIIDSHPALKAASPQAPMTDLFMGDDSYHGGAFMLEANFDFYSSFKPQENPQLPQKTFVPFDYGTKDGYEFYLKLGPTGNLSKLLAGRSELWDDQLHHDTYDEYWKVRNLAPHMNNIHCAVLTVGGWFDAEDLQGPFSTFHSIDQKNPGIFNALVVGPWIHGGWARLDGEHLGRVNFAANTGDYYRSNILFPFFEQYLKGKGDAKLPKAYVFETGTNVWRKYSAWPPKNAEAKTLYFRAHGELSFDPPSVSESTGVSDSREYDEYVSDPAKPVPFVSYQATNVPQEYMVSDQRFAAGRTDVLVYQTPVLQQDVTIAGPISPRLFVSTSNTDSDFDVKLIDVYPADYPDSKLDAREDDSKPRTDVGAPAFTMGGYQQLVRGEPFRGKFRHSFERPEPFTPGKVEEIDATFPDVNHTFRRGHRIMVQVQSSWFPLTDRNPQTFVDIPDAKPSDFVKATERVYHTKTEPSGIGVGVLVGAEGQRP
ncbi:MAG TPA: CocE/NonD family hydrolase [Terriglobales bacterium]|jgi:putative CocE/NonD family hydrolase|nr:CocE/NonD family hydrolase [Terriglobales bacterium]